MSRRRVGLHLIEGFIDNETPIASGSGTQQYTLWNATQAIDHLWACILGIQAYTYISNVPHNITIGPNLQSGPAVK